MSHYPQPSASGLRLRWIFAVAALVSGVVSAQELPSKAPNFGSVANTRHNLTQSFLSAAGANWMSLSRNDYGEVCVYCHTPHGANQSFAAPLWNRSAPNTTYTPYSSSTLSQTPTQPGAASLTCLSCHDGQTAVDSIVNMPGSGRHSASQYTGQNNSFLDAWPGGPGGSAFGGHGTLEVSAAAFDRFGECQSCHSISGDQHDPSTTPRFDVFYIGTDLSNDHPVGVTYPAANPDFNPNTVNVGSLKFFDLDGNGRADKNEVRLYNSGGGFEVECASCHDPHGVPSAGNGSTFIPTFLRVANTGSALCLTCHTK